MKRDEHIFPPVCVEGCTKVFLNKETTISIQTLRKQFIRYSCVMSYDFDLCIITLTPIGDEKEPSLDDLRSFFGDFLKEMTLHEIIISGGLFHGMVFRVAPSPEKKY